MRIAGVVTSAGCGVLFAGMLSGCTASAEQDMVAVAVATRSVSLGDSDQDGYLVMPHLGVEVQATGVETDLSQLEARALDLGDEDMSAPDGQEFVVAMLEPGYSPFAESPAEAGEATLTLDADGATEDLTELITEAGTVSPLLIAAAVDEGAPVTLSIASEGKTASLDLRTGERADDADTAAGEAYYTSPTEQSGEFTSAGSVGLSDATTAAVLGGPEETTVSVSLDNATVTPQPWLPGQGWAPEGSRYLLLQGIYQSISGAPSWCLTTSWNPTASLTLAADGSAAVGAVASSDTTNQLTLEVDLDGWSVAYEVPADSTEATLAIAPQVSVGDDCSIYQAFPAGTLPVTLE